VPLILALYDLNIIINHSNLTFLIKIISLECDIDLFLLYR